MRTRYGSLASRDKYFVITSFILSASIIATRNKCAGGSSHETLRRNNFLVPLDLSKRIKRTINNDLNNEVLVRLMRAIACPTHPLACAQLRESYRHLVEAIC